MANLIKPKILWEKNLNEGLVTLGCTVGISVGGCLKLIDV